GTNSFNSPEREAIAWHRSYMRSRSCVADLSWTEYILALNKRFGEEFEDFMEALKSLTQTGKVAKPKRFTDNGLGRRLTAAEMDEKRAKGLCFSVMINMWYQGKKHVLKGASNQLKSTGAKSINKVDVDETQFFMMSILFGTEDRLQCYNIHIGQGNLINPALSLLIDQYASIFEIPTTLPPHRNSFDHRIPLVESANPVNKRPYRYSMVKRIS
ncbi:hypothetical protein H5410_031692, partial [Solanum commersonii]